MQSVTKINILISGFFSMDEMFRLGDLSDFWGMQLICGTYPYLQNFDLFKLHLCPNK